MNQKTKFIAFLSLFLIFSFFISENLMSQDFALIEKDKSALSGYVKDKETGETIVGAVVFLENTKYGARTNKMGYFTVNNIPPAKYKVIISFLGYEKLFTEIELKGGENVRKEFELKSTSLMQDEIYVEAEKEVEKRQISISKVNVPVQTIKSMSIGGESDIFRTLQYLPGVLTSSQISSGLFIRGGSPDQNLVLLDGSTVYNPTHLFGFISTFNTDAIKDVELVKGGFDAEYGGRLSAVLNITQNDGNSKKFEGVASLGAISSRLGLQGPIGNGSWSISGRRTYFEIVKSFLPDDPETPIPDFGFYDLNAKITQNLGDNDIVSISGFLSNDNLIFSATGFGLDLDVGNRLLSGRWTHIFNEDLITVLNGSYSKYSNNFFGDQSGYEFLIENSITDYTLKTNTEWFISDNITSKFGVETNYFVFKYLQNLSGDTDSTVQNTNGSTNLTIDDFHGSAFTQFKIAFTDPFSVQAGLRMNYWKLSDLVTFDPRLSARYRFNDKLALKFAWGIFHQNLRLASQPNFSFFDTWLPTDKNLPASKSVHYILSLETEPIERHNLNFDIYYKTLDNISELNTNTLNGNELTEIFYFGNAEAWGAEVFMQKKIGRLNGWVGYAIGFINAQFDSINNGKSFNPKYDRTHDFKIVANYMINDDWDIGASFFFQSGQPYTGATSRFQTKLGWDQESGRGKIVTSQRYGLRLPPSHQLNLTASYKFLMWGLKSKFIIDIYNVYSRRDILTRFWNTREENTYYEDVKLIPILPTVSLEVTF